VALVNTSSTGKYLLALPKNIVYVRPVIEPKPSLEILCNIERYRANLGTSGKLSSLTSYAMAQKFLLP